MIINPTVRDNSDRWDSDCEDEQLWWPRVVWVDPGVTSGVSVVWFDPKALLVEEAPISRCVLAWWESYVGGPEVAQVDRFLDIAGTLKGEFPGLALGIESFVPRQFNQSPEFLAPVRIRAAYEYAVSKRFLRGRVAVQNPSDALSNITDQRLKMWDMYTPGPDHIRDATRHALLWVRRFRQTGRGLETFRAWHGWQREWFA